MKKQTIRFGLILLIALSICSFLYLNKCTSVQQNVSMIELQEFNAKKEQVLSGVKQFSTVMQKIVDIVTSRQS